MTKGIFGCALLLISLASCKKEIQELQAQKINIPSGATIRDIAIANDGRWVICGKDGDKGVVLVTKDGGISWNRTFFLNEMNTVAMEDSLSGIAGDADILVYRTNDGGITWNQFVPEIYPLSVNRVLRGACFANASKGFICGGKNFENGVLYETFDGGQTWNFSEYNHELRSIAFSDSLNGVLGGYGVMYITADGGNHWNLTSNSGIFFTGLTSSVDGDFWASAFNGSILFSSDKGQTWTEKKKGSTWNVAASALNCIGYSASGKIAGGGPDGFITWSTDGGNSWNERITCDHNDILSLEWLNEQTILITTKNGGLYRFGI